MSEYLPFIQSDNNYTLRVPLDGTTYQFRVRWNSRDGAWYMDLANEDLTPIAYGLKIVLGARLGAALQHLSFFQEHILTVVDTTSHGLDAAFDDLGDRIQVAHTTVDEFRNGITS